MSHYKDQAASLAFEENQRPDRYAVAIPEGRVKISYGKCIGAIYLRAATDGSRGVQQQLGITEGLRNIKPPGSDELASGHQSAIAAGKIAQLKSPGLTEFQTLATESACRRLGYDGNVVLGGIALFEQRQNYAAGIFYHQVLADEAENTVHNLRREHSQNRRDYREISDPLAAMTELFTELGTDDKVEAFAITAARSIVTQLYAEAVTQPQEVRDLVPLTI